MGAAGRNFSQSCWTGTVLTVREQRSARDAESSQRSAALRIGNAGSMPVFGMPSTVVPASPMWQSATFQTRMPILADQARLGMFSIGDIALLGGGILIVAICLRRTRERTRQEVRKKTGLLRPFPPLGFLVTRLVAYETDGCCKQDYTSNRDRR